MPCYDLRSGDCSDIEKRLQSATRAACDLWQALRSSSDQKPVEGLSPETMKWVRAHDQQDRLHQEAEQRRADVKRKQEAALGKLTPEERRLLGLDKF